MKRAAVLPLFAGLTGASRSLAFAQAAPRTPYKIGLTYPLTGPLAQITAEYIPAVQLAVDDVNRRGGVRGRKLQILVEDTQATPQGGIAALRKLAQVDGVQAALTIYTNVVSAQLPLADQLKVPIIAPIEAPGVVNTSQYGFAHAVGLDDVAPVLTRFWRQSRAKRVFAFLVNNGFGHTIEPTVHEAARAAGADYDVAFVDLGTTDYRGPIIRAKGFDPDQIFVAAQGGPVETGIVRQVRELDITCQLVGPAVSYESHSWRDAVGPYAEGMVFSGLYVDPRISGDFVHAYRAKVGYDPIYVAAQVYDQLKMIAYSIEQAGYDGTAIRNVLLMLRGFPSVFGGTIEMRPTHYTKINAIGLFQVRRGKLVRVPLA